ncbi:hypothetical protein D9M70_558570 [compost metagenome]
MLAVEHQFPLALEDLVTGPDEPELLVTRGFVHVGPDPVDRVADEDRLDEAQLVVAIGKRVDAVGGDEPETGGEHEGAGNETPAEHAIALGEHLILNIGVDVDDQRVEQMAVPLSDRPAQRSNALAYGPIFIEPVFRIPHRQGGMVLRHVRGMRRGNTDGGREFMHEQTLA